MDGLLNLLAGIIQITLLDIVLAGDNLGVIALATKDLPKEYAKKASAIGVSAAILMRIFFASIITMLFNIQWLPIKLVGGLILVKITWDFIKPNNEKENVNLKSKDKFWSAVTTIIIADVTMSLDNVLAIGGAARGNIWFIVFGLLLNIPLIFYGSYFVAEMMRRYPIVIYIGGAVLAHTAIGMVAEDSLVYSRIPHILAMILPNASGVLVLIYGLYEVRSV